MSGTLTNRSTGRLPLPQAPGAGAGYLNRYGEHVMKDIFKNIISAIIGATIALIFGWFGTGLKDLKENIDKVPVLEMRINNLASDTKEYTYLKLPVHQGRVITSGDGKGLPGVAVEQYLITDKDPSIPECNSKDHRGRAFISAISSQNGEDGLCICMDGGARTEVGWYCINP